MPSLHRLAARSCSHIGGFVQNGRLRYAIEIPSGLSMLVGYKPSTVVHGLNETAPADRPPVNVVHWAFDTMAGLGLALLALGVWLAVYWWRHRDVPRTRWFLRAGAASGIAAVTCLEAGWVVTEVGRQPWVVYRTLRTADAVNPAPGLVWGLAIVAATYVVLTVAAAYVLRRMAGQAPECPDGGPDGRDGGADGGGGDGDRPLAPQQPTGVTV